MTPQQLVDDALDRILKAAGTTLKNYTIQSRIDEMRKEMRQIMVNEYIKGSNDAAEAIAKIIEKALDN